jgi:inorganic pyrophosphatase
MAEVTMSGISFFDTAPLYEIDAYHRAETPMDAVAFIGNPRKHPYDGEKFILIEDPFGDSAAIFEFRFRDIVSVETVPSPVTSTGTGIKMVKLWVRKGCYGLRYLPFEVADPPKYFQDSKPLRDRLARACT